VQVSIIICLFTKSLVVSVKRLTADERNSTILMILTTL